MSFTYEILLDTELFVGFEDEAVASAVSLFWLRVTINNAADKEDDSEALVGETVVALVAVVG
jgi:hypothetical protein